MPWGKRGMASSPTPAASEAAASELAHHHHELARAVCLALSRDTARNAATGSARRTVVDEILIYLQEALHARDILLFLHYLEWLRTTSETAIAHEDLARILNALGKTVARTLPDEATAAVHGMLEAGHDLLQHKPAEPASFIEPEAPLGDLARRYLDAILDGDHRQAQGLVMDAVQGEVLVEDIYLHVFQAAQYEIGRLWQLNRASVAQEHFATATTQLTMSRLYPYIYSRERVGRRAVVACVGDELHELGARMVADFFELGGWDTYFLGANTPAESVVWALQDQAADILAISVTMASHVAAVEPLVRRARAADRDGIKILVGGYPFVISPRLCEAIGADGNGMDAREAIGTATRLLAAGDHG